MRPAIDIAINNNYTNTGVIKTDATSYIKRGIMRWWWQWRKWRIETRISQALLQLNPVSEWNMKHVNPMTTFKKRQIRRQQDS